MEQEKRVESPHGARDQSLKQVAGRQGTPLCHLTADNIRLPREYLLILI